jgi:hypothetical protein
MRCTKYERGVRRVVQESADTNKLACGQFEGIASQLPLPNR